jgi:ubiquitin C
VSIFLALAMATATSVSPANAMPIQIKPPEEPRFALSKGDTWAIDVEPSDTVGSAKVKIQDRFSVEPENQILTYGGKELDDNRTFSDYNIQRDTVITFSLRNPLPPLMIKIFVKTLSGKTLTIEIEPSETIDALKQKILEKEGIPVDLQILSFEGQLLTGSQTIAQSNIRFDSNVNLETKTITVVKPFKPTLTTIQYSYKSSSVATSMKSKLKQLVKDSKPAKLMSVVGYSWNSTKDKSWHLKIAKLRATQIASLLSSYGYVGKISVRWGTSKKEQKVVVRIS